MYVYGGLDETQTCSADLYGLNCETWIWQSLGKFIVDDNEIKVCGHSSANFEDKILIFGGLDPSSTIIYNQIFIYNTNEKTWGRVEQRKPPRFCGNVLVKERKAVLLGGCNLVTRTVPAVDIIDIDNLVIDLLG